MILSARRNFFCYGEYDTFAKISTFVLYMIRLANGHKYD